MGKSIMKKEEFDSIIKRLIEIKENKDVYSPSKQLHASVAVFSIAPQAPPFTRYAFGVLL
jgi:hypothetical protein